MRRLAELHEAGGRVVFAGDVPAQPTAPTDAAEFAVLAESISGVAFTMDTETEARMLSDSERMDGISAAYLGARDPDHFATGVSAGRAVLVVPEDEVGRLARLLALTCGRYALQPSGTVHDLRLAVHQDADLEIAFLLNVGHQVLEFELDVVSQAPAVLERWDALDGSRVPVIVHREVSEVSRVPVSLQPLESRLLVLRPLQPGEAEPVLPARTRRDRDKVILSLHDAPDTACVQSQSLVVEGEVQVEQDPPLSIPRRLGDWRELGLEDFSGCVAYEFAFTMAPEYLSAPVYLDLGEVCYSARMDLNGHALTSLWAPHVLEVSGMLVEGDNRLRVEVVNTLANQIASERVVEDARVHGWFNTYYARALPMMRESLPSGLMGPVRLWTWD
jgi:hypothetical protein